MGTYTVQPDIFDCFRYSYVIHISSIDQSKFQHFIVCLIKKFYEKYRNQ